MTKHNVVSDITRGRRAPHRSTTVYVTNKGGFDVEDAMAFAGDESKVPMVYLTEGSVRKENTAEISQAMQDKLRFFDVTQDILMIAGRALANLMVGSVMQELFSGRTVKILIWDARNQSYDIEDWVVPGDLEERLNY